MEQAKAFVAAGHICVAEIDIKDFFDSIPLEAMIQIVRDGIRDERVVNLVEKYLHCRLDIDGNIVNKTKGLVQGSSLSPVFSNMYLHGLDAYMESKSYKWIRFADNIYIYCKSEDEAAGCYNDIVWQLEEVYKLEINDKKSGVHDAFVKPLLGYDFFSHKGDVDVRKHQYKEVDTYHRWHDSVVQKINKEYHILQDGILNKKDYALLFENEDGKHHIPVEVVDCLNIYGEVTMAASVFRTLGDKHIRLSFFDKYGSLCGVYTSQGHTGTITVLLKQCELYSNASARLNIAKQLENASIHNMRANLRYYNKKESVNLTECIEMLTKCIVDINEGKDINALMLIEARARQRYYAAFNDIISNDNFAFHNRSKRPPKDAINAMISFGNTLLYNAFAQAIWKTPLDIRIGIIHAANRRNCSLNLDFADVFKPIITDRVIFSLINCQQIKVDEHFEVQENGGVFLNKQGKRIFLQEFEQKLNTRLVIKGESLTYRQQFLKEVRRFQYYVMTGEKYKPYKYY